jgi:hypothetical protein
VLRTQQGLDLRCCQEEFEELGHELLVQEPVTDLGVDAVGLRPHVVGCQTEQEIVVELRDQHPLRAKSGRIDGRPASG